MSIKEEQETVWVLIHTRHHPLLNGSVQTNNS